MNDDKYLKEYTKLAFGDVIKPIEEVLKNDGEYPEAYPTGYGIFDRAMKVDGEFQGGVRDGDLIMVTGASGSGKTSFCQNLALRFKEQALPVLFFSYEVAIDHLYAKFKKMGYDNNGIIVAPQNLVSGDTAWIKQKIIEAKEKYMIKVIFIDHLDFLSAGRDFEKESLRVKLKKIVQDLKIIANEEEVIIYLMVHAKKVQGRVIQKEDMAESSGMHQLADYVFIVSRLYDPQENAGEDIELATDEGNIRLDKNRLTGKQVYMKFRMVDDVIKPYVS